MLIEIPTQLTQIWKSLSLEVKQKYEGLLTFRWLLFQPRGLNSGFGQETSQNLSLNKMSGPVLMCQPLIHSLIKSFLDDGMAVDTLCLRLRQHCPQLFTAEDAVAANALELLQQAHHTMVNEGSLEPGKQSSIETEQKLAHAIALLLQVASSINLGVIAQTVKACGAHDGLLKICLESARARDPHKNAHHCSPIVQHVQEKLADGTSKLNYSHDNEVCQSALEARYDCYRVALNCLDDVINIVDNKPDLTEYPEKFKRKVELMWKFSLQSKDQLWHYALYDYLNDKSSQRSRLSRLNTPYIQNWFDFISENNAAKNALLYAEWLESSERYADAAKILYRLAMLDSAASIQPTNTSDIEKASNHNLAFKIELLSRALVNAKASSDPELVSEVNDRMEVAEVQQIIVKLLRKRAEASFENLSDYQQGIQIAESKLLPLNDLYRAFGEAQNMPDVQLLVLHCAGQGDSAIIEHLWRATIDGCLTDEKTSDPRYDLTDHRACIPAIREKILFLTHTFLTLRSTADTLSSAANASKYFPLRVIVRYLEQMTCQFGWYQEHHGWVAEMFATIAGYRIGKKCVLSNDSAMITIKELLDVYHSIYKEHDPFWLDQVNQPFYILASIEALIKKLIVSPLQKNHQIGYLSINVEEKSIMSYGLDLICSYLIELQSITNISFEEKTITENLKKLKSTIEFCGIQHQT